MGKARILEAHGEGRYTIEIVEARERAESAKKQAQGRIAEHESALLALDSDIDSAQVAVNSAAADQDEAVAAYRNGNLDIKHLSKYAEAIAQAAGKRDQLVSQKRAKEMLIAADETLIARVDALPPLRKMQVWCADYTEDLSGEIATAEVPGEIGSVIIKPGSEGRGWSSSDGAMQPALAGTPAGTFYNLAMMPGWQKWRPTYRVATITAIDGDQCDIDLDSASSSQQGLNVNTRNSYSNVQILYMDCNGGAFEEGDRVLVAFAGNVDGPLVVGFEKEPRGCSIYVLRAQGMAIKASYDNLSVGKDAGYPPLPEGWDSNNAATRLRMLVNSSREQKIYYSYGKQSQIEGLESKTSIQQARIFLRDYLVSNYKEVTEHGVGNEKYIGSTGRLEQSLVSIHYTDDSGETVEKTERHSMYGLYPSNTGGLYLRPRFNYQWSSSVGRAQASISWSDSNSQGRGVFKTSEGRTEMRLSNEITGSPDVRIEGSVYASDVPEYIEMEGTRYVFNRFVTFKGSESSIIPDVLYNSLFTEYVREDKAT